MEEKVTLSYLAPGEASATKRSFDLDHAQRILDIGLKTPPCDWKLSDDKYEVINGKITKRSGKGTPPESQK